MNAELIVKEIAHVLKTGGTAIITLPNAFNTFERVSLLLSGNSTGYKTESMTMSYGHISMLPGNVIRSLANRAALEVLDCAGGLLLRRWIFRASTPALVATMKL